MDRHVLHNIIHRDANNSSKDCPVCNGSVGMNDKSALMGKANDILARKQQMGMSYNEDEQDLVDFAELSSKARNTPEDSAFAYIDSKGEKHLSISDAGHTRDTLTQFSEFKFDSDDDKKKTKAKIDAAAKKFGVEVSEEKKASEPTLRSIINVMEFSEKQDEPPEKFKLLKSGIINSPRYGRIELNKKIFEEMIQNFEKNIRASSSKAGLPIDLEHGETQVKDAAGGWMKKLFIEDGDLWTQTEWTDLGKDALKKKLYKFISPAFFLKGFKHPETGKEYDNVLTGAGLVNRPGMPSLPPLVNSEAHENTPLTAEKESSTVFIEIKNISTPKMTFKEIIAKEKTARTSEEQEYLANHKEDAKKELTYEEYSNEFPQEITAKEGKETVKEGQIVMSEQDVKTMKDDIEAGKKAFAELQVIKKEKDLMDMTNKVKELAFVEGEGVRLPADQVEKWAAKLVEMSEADRTDALDMLKSIPVKAIFKEEGSESAINMSENPQSQVNALIQSKQEEAKKNGTTLSYSQAEGMVYAEKPNLRQSIYGR